jgi:hypothetical protein
MVDVQQRTLSPFEQQARAVTERFVGEQRRVAEQGDDPRRQRGERRHDLLDGGDLAAERGDHRRPVLDRDSDLL